MNNIESGVIIAIISLFGTIISLVAQWRKNKADYADKIAGSAIELLENMKCELKEVKNELKITNARVKSLEKTTATQAETIIIQTKKINDLEAIVEKQKHSIETLTTGIKKLIKQVTDMGGTPVWKLQRK